MPIVTEVEDTRVTVEADPTVTVVEVDNAQPVVEIDAQVTTVVIGTGASLPEELQMDTGRLLGRVDPGVGPVQQLTPTQATTLINLFTNDLKGLVPPPDGAPDDWVLSATGEWIEGGGGGEGTVTDVQGDDINISVDDSTPEAPIVQMTDMPNATLKGRALGSGSGQPVNLDAEQIRALINLGAMSEVRGASFVGFNAAIHLPANDVPVIIKEDCTITGCVVLTLGGPGSCVIDIWNDSYSQYPPTVADSICTLNKPTVVAGIKHQSSLVNWGTALSANDTVYFHLESVSTFTAVFIFLILEPVGSTAADGYTDERAREIVLEELGDFDFSLYIPTSVPPVADTIPLRDGDAFMYSETPAAGDSSEKVATTEFINPGSTIAASGYRIHPDGLIEQWGFDTRTGSAAQTITFPIPFPNALFTINANPRRSSGDALGQIPTIIGSPTLADFELAHADASVGSYWTAKGN